MLLIAILFVRFTWWYSKN